MANTPTADSIQIEIEASSDKAISKLNSLIDSLQKIKSASAGFTSSLKNVVTGINSLEKIKEIKNAETVAKQLEALKRAANGFSNNVGDNLVLLAAGLKELSGISISKTAAENMTKLSEALRNIHEKDAQRVSAVAQSMTAISQVPSMTSAINQLGKLPEVLERIQGADISGVAGKIRELADAMAPLADRMKSVYAGFSSLPKSVQDFAKGYKAEQPKVPEAPKDSDKEVIEPEESLQKKLGIIQRIADVISKISGKKIDIGSAGGLKDLLGKDLSLQNLIPKGIEGAMGKAGDIFKGLADKGLSFASAHPAISAALVGLKSAGQTLWNGLKGLAKFSFSTLKKGFDLVSGAAKKLTSSLANLVRAGINKAVSGLKSMAKFIGSKFTAPFRKAIEQVVKWKQMLGSALFYSTVFKAMSLLSTAIKEGIDNLYQYSKIVGTNFAPAMDKLATSALYLKNSVGAMAAPLIEAVAPAVDYLVDKFVELLNVIGKTFAALTGKDVYSQARKHAVEYAESAEEAKKETEKFKKFLLGIDELNIMPSQDEYDAEKKNPLEDYASMFEEVKVPVEQMDWAKQIREAIENGDWYSVGRILAEKLNEIVDGWDAYAWGRKLGELVTNGLNVAFGFLENFDFGNLGKKLADWINGAFDGIDWSLLGRTMAEKWNALFDFIYGFATSLNWTGIGLDIANALNGFLDQLDPEKAAAAVNEFVLGIFRTLNTAITETNWAELGEKLGQFLNEIDWKGIVYNGLIVIVNGITAVKQAVDAFLAEWDWKTMADEIASGINAALSDVDWDGLGRTLSDLLYSLFGFAFEFLPNIDWMQIGQGLIDGLNGFIDELGVNLDIKSFTDPIVGAVSTLFGGLQTIVEQTKTWLDGIDLGPAAESFQKLMEAVSPLVETITNGLAWAWENVLLPLAGWFIEDAAPAGIELLTSALKALNDILVALSPAFDFLFNNILKPLASFVGGAFVGAINLLSSALNGIAALIQGFIDSIANALNALNNFMNSAKNAGPSFGSGGNKQFGNVGRAFANDFSYNIKLQNIEAPKAYASGGFPSSGEMFIAREKGPELVGKIGQKTAVANNDQITSGIADGMRDANTDVVNAVYAMANMIVKAVEEKDTDINLDGQSLARGIQPYQNRLSSLQGASLVD